MNRTSTTRSDDILAGGLIIGISIWGFIGYIPCLFVILKSNELWKLAFYRFVVSLGVIDTLGLLVWFLTGIFVVTHGESFISAAFVDILMNILLYLWFNISWHLIAIAFNRCVGVIAPAQLVRFFKPASKSTKWLVAIYTIALILTIPSWIPPGCYFQLDGYWFLFGTASVANFYFFLELILNSGVIIVLAAMYLLIIRGLRANTIRVGDSTNSEQLKAQHMLKVRMVTQVFIVSALYYAFFIAFYSSPYLVSDLWSLYVCGTMMWVFNHAVNPWVYIVFNPKIRSGIVRVFWKKTDPDTVVFLN